MSCGGASSEQKAQGQQQQATAQTLTDAFNSRFAGQTAILNKLNGAYSAQIAAGPSAGFDAATRRAIEARTLDTTSANYSNAARAVGGQLAGRGGDTGILSGVDAQIKGAIAAESAKTLSGEQTDIALQDAALGRQNYNSALTGMNELSRQYDPTQYSSQSMTAEKNAYDTQKSIDSQKGGFWKTLGGIATTGLGIASNFLAPGVGASVGALSKGLSMAKSAASGMNNIMDTSGQLDDPETSGHNFPQWNGLPPHYGSNTE